MTPFTYGPDHKERKEQVVRTALQHTWGELVRCGMTEDCMPEPIAVNLADIGVR